ncbi:MAG: amino acid permease [Halobacteriovoraceae bacterium]|nr:amino acid permease [Halobacteriovoraceae bacterium]|tara:strand:- start:13101 stop:14387 length:1287 start_codon:yes stop_codon:yes gene_type:complete
MSEYNKGSLSLIGTIAMGTGVMVGAGIFALTGEIANYAGKYFTLAFLGAGIMAAITSYTYIKMSNAYPSSGGIGMILKKCYGASPIAAWGGLLMFFSMVINQSLVARTFGNYITQIDGIGIGKGAIPWLGLCLVIFSFLINILNNKWIQGFSLVTAVIKVVGLLALAFGGLYASGVNLMFIRETSSETGALSFIGAVALGVLAFKGFTTITNSGDEIEEPHKNVGRAIGISLILCLAIYMVVTVAVGSSLSLQEILDAKNYSLAEAARPLYGEWGVRATVGMAIIATVSGIIASMFAVSRMLAMLTKMEMVPHKHFGMPGGIQKHTLVYTAVLAGLMTVTFDVSRIAALGAFFYITMDILIHWGVLTRTDHSEVKVEKWVLKTSIGLDLLILFGLFYIKAKDDLTIIWIALVSMAVIYFYEKHFFKAK